MARKYSTYKKYDRAMKNFSKGLDKTARVLDRSLKSSSRSSKSTSRSAAYYSAQPTESAENLFGWVLTIMAIMALLFALLIGFIFGFDVYFCRMPLVLAGIMFFIAMIIFLSNTSSSESASGKNRQDDRIGRIRSASQAHSNPVCREILERYSNYLQLKNDIVSAEEEARVAFEKTSGSKNQKKLERYKTAVDTLNELKQKELVARSEICNCRNEGFDELLTALSLLKSSSKVWVRANNTKVSATVSWKKCDFVKTDFDVIAIDSIFGEYFFYPNLILKKGQSLADIDAVSFKNIRIEYVESEYLEKNEAPSDARVIRQSWEHQNLDGTPNRRYKENALLNYVIYGKIKVGEDFPTIIVSNLNAARQLKDALNKYLLTL